MRKIFFLLICCLSITAHAVDLNHFINPLFYEDMKPRTRSMNNNVFRITPTEITTSANGFNTLTTVSKCRLVDQSQTRVLLKCFEKSDEDNSDMIMFYLFVMTKADTENNRCLVTSYFHHFTNFWELELDFDEKTIDAIKMYHYIESTDCGITEE